jgi:putative RNA 2'-phosphotransferase
MLVYILGHRPFEFGIVPDVEGFVPFKDLLQVFREEPGWGFVREGSINEVLICEDRSLFEADGQRIRATDRRWKFDSEEKTLLPAKILFLSIRRKAHPVIMDKGLRKIDGSTYILSPDRNMAERIGKRRDPQPVLLEIMAEAAQKDGLLFHAFGDLVLTSEIPVRFIAGPPVPKSVIKTREEKENKKQDQGDVSQFKAGTFVLDLERDPHQYRKDKGRKKRSWKEDARKDRRTMRTNPW